MAHLLKNINLEVHIDLPHENYKFSRFDWTGKISEVKYQNMLLSAVEQINCENEHQYGKGFYNEFGIDTALGFDETPIGGWFHKIGVGLLKKDTHQYRFSKNYEIRAAAFKNSIESNKIVISCNSENINGYCYVLHKEIILEESGFTINYHLENTGDRDIITDEYVHNFTAINKEQIGPDYVLKFPFHLKPDQFGESVNPKRKVELGSYEINFKRSPNKEFFFSMLSGNESIAAKWTLINLRHGIGISETGNFQTNKVNLWGDKHVISPELFFVISVKPGQYVKWSRTYEVYKLKMKE